jgi:hypothetical protein
MAIGVGAGSLPALPRVGDGDAQRGDPGQVQTCGSVRHVETDEWGFHGIFHGDIPGDHIGMEIQWGNT